MNVTLIDAGRVRFHAWILARKRAGRMSPVVSAAMP